MKKFLLCILLIFIVANGHSTEKLTEIVRFASIKRSKRLLTQEDKFTNSLSPMDIDIRMQKSNSTKDELLNFIPTQVKKWHEKEKNILLSILEKIDNEIIENSYEIDFPDTIYFVKTTLDEEFEGATGYTRSNYIVFNGNKITETNPLLIHIVVHELFHILSKQNPEFQAKMYKIIGFSLGNEIQLPDKLKYYKLTNPDAPFNNAFIKLKNNDQPIECMMITYADKKYSEGNLRDYAKIGFLKLTGSEVKKAEEVNGEPVIISINDVSGFFEQIGQNTQYIVHPEEILGDNFAFTILNKKGLPNPEIQDEIRKILKNKTP